MNIENVKENTLINKVILKRFYNSLDWKKLRNQIINTKENKCCKCSSVESLCVDHIKPIKLKPSYALKKKNLRIICTNCNINKGSKIEPNPEISKTERKVKITVGKSCYKKYFVKRELNMTEAEQVIKIREIMANDCPDYIFKFGKYKGCSLSSVMFEDEQYVDWFYSNVNSIPSNVKDFIARKLY